MNPIAIPVVIIDAMYAVYMGIFARKTIIAIKKGDPTGTVQIVTALIGVLVLVIATVYVLQLD